MLVAGAPRMTGCEARDARRRGRYDVTMSEPALAPRSAFHGMIAVWIVSLVVAVALGFVLPEEDRVGWLLIAFGGIVLVSFAVQLAHGRAEGFIVRMAGSVVGALMIMGAVSAVFGIAALASAL